MEFIPQSATDRRHFNMVVPKQNNRFTHHHDEFASVQSADEWSEMTSFGQSELKLHLACYSR